MSIQVNEEALEELKKQLTPKGIGKVILGTLVSLGATAAVIAAFRNPMKGTKGLLKILMAAGVFVLACKAGDIAEEHCGEMIDDTADTIGEFFKELKQEGEDQQNGGDTNNGRYSQQQPEKQGNGSEQRATATEDTGKASPSPVRWRWWGKKERAKQVLEVDEKNVPE